MELISFNSVTLIPFVFSDNHWTEDTYPPGPAVTRSGTQLQINLFSKCKHNSFYFAMNIAQTTSEQCSHRVSLNNLSHTGGSDLYTKCGTVDMFRDWMSWLSLLYRYTYSFRLSKGKLDIFLSASTVGVKKLSFDNLLQMTVLYNEKHPQRLTSTVLMTNQTLHVHAYKALEMGFVLYKRKECKCSVHVKYSISSRDAGNQSKVGTSCISNFLNYSK